MGVAKYLNQLITKVKKYLDNNTLTLGYFNLALFFKRFYLFMIDTERERGRDTGRGSSRLHARSPMWDLIPGLQDHTLG